MTLLAWVMVVVGFVTGVVVGVSCTVALVVGLWRWAKRVVAQAQEETPTEPPVESRDPLWVSDSRGYN